MSIFATASDRTMCCKFGPEVKVMSKASAVLTGLMLATLLLGWGAVEVRAQKSSVPKPQDKVAIGEDDVRRLLQLMDTDKNGKISKQEFMRFMEEEFQRLDKNKDGQLDVKELTRSRIKAAPASNAQIK
jgi:hypothetical protein